ncbi:MAG: transcriptional repressor [Candidatus Hydrogenedentes bacterium]|nr:transcriptional repressor [Candidatus Hydrogenedentota bacterium]
MERDTSQRRAIRQVFRDSGRPLSPQEVLEFARAHAPNLGIATVYRSVKTLMEDGWLVPVEIPGEPQRYEIAGKDHHHHFSCRSCGRMYDFDGCPSNLGGLVPAGFQMEDHEIFLYGRCADCLETKA